jgi:hypothetical protein
MPEREAVILALARPCRADFVFTHEWDGTEVALEIVGY